MDDPNPYTSPSANADERRGSQFHWTTLVVSAAVAGVTVAWGAAVSFKPLELAPYAAAALIGWLSWRVLRVSAFGMIAGLIGTDFLILYTVCLAEAQCPMTLGFQAVFLLAGIACMAVSCVLFFLLPRKGNMWRKVAAGLSAVLVVLAIFFLMAFPLAIRHRRAMRLGLMEQRIPILMSVVADVEASRRRLGHIPADTGAFYALIRKDIYNSLSLLDCCWGWDYKKLEADRYRLRYFALDVDYVYDSATPERGWFPNDRQRKQWDAD